ncbi:MAG: hypothetical protein ACD_79C00182G0002 [uncultured bacterium]|nr:MAG: hypothetical protein ACD_79C00182G0002 [uncultured bacterium]
MSKAELETRLSKEINLSKRDSIKTVNLIFETIKNQLRAGEKIIIHGFGTFSVKKYEAKIYQDVKTGKIKTLPDRKKVKFQPSKNILNK